MCHRKLCRKTPRGYTAAGQKQLEGRLLFTRQPEDPFRGSILQVLEKTLPDTGVSYAFLSCAEEKAVKQIHHLMCVRRV